MIYMYLVIFQGRTNPDIIGKSAFQSINVYELNTMA